ncbi:DUF6167 family protein [Streptomyces populi]|uniref:Secreted protein n=1 Tax=Streptomyces triticiradicis TaxID=2651189 RepID=A0A7J5DL91_9ACTN|nr:DUF6167 family protein [Streptomyces triticiradicis]KAB1989495.1 hypothetical protein F8144_07625 [Streptomyces triticiradicis]
MFRRTFWFTAGAAAGVWATTKVNRKLRQLTPESLAAQAANKAIDAGHRLKEFALDVRDGMAQREAELGEVLGLNGHPDPELPTQRRIRAIGGGQSGDNKQIKYIDNTTYSYNRNEDH